MRCAQRFKPVVYLAEGENFGPTTVDAFLRGCVLRKYGDCGHAADPVEVGLNQTGF